MLNGLAGHSAALDLLTRVSAVYLIYLVVPAALLLWFWPSPTRAARQRVVGMMALSAVLALGLGAITAQVHFESRPFVLDPSVHMVIRHAADASFPTDHVLVGAAVAWVLLWWRRAAGWAALGVTLLLGVARVVAGVHWPIDILASVAIAALAAWLAIMTTALWAIPQRLASRVLPAWLVSAP